jgi:trans-aconitate 2-methyltransferase
MATHWDPTLYLKFGNERTRAAADLLARVLLTEPKLIVDIGCGPGNSTALLRARFPNARIIGMDSSPDMLADAARSGIEAEWVQGDFESFTPPSPPDLIYANASLQWSANPLALTQRLFGLLGPGGGLALQVPHNQDDASYLAVRDVVQSSRWKDALKNAKQYDPGFAKATDYYNAIAGLGGASDIWTTTYYHRLDGEDPVFRFLSGTGLRPFTQALEGEERAGFEAEIKQRFARAFPRQGDGSTLFPFRRLFCIATRPHQ